MAAGPGLGGYAPATSHPALGKTVARLPPAAKLSKTASIARDLDCLRSLANHNVR
jgi:hypothetical protein